MTTGRTIWDFLYDKGILFLVIFGFIIFTFFMFTHPKIIKEWNAIVTNWMAKWIPKKRKSAFEKNLSIIIDTAKDNFIKESPQFFQKFLPYDLKVEWVNKDEEAGTIFNGKQVVVYVPDYKNETNQTISVIHNYCVKGFAEKAKMYMGEDTKIATDLVLTRKIVQLSSPHIYDYFSREYIKTMYRENPTFNAVYNGLCLIDNDGLFIPLLMNEIDKFAAKLHPIEPNEEIASIIVKFTQFIYKIANRKQNENSNTIFVNGIKIRIILAVSKETLDITNAIKAMKGDLKRNIINSFYVLASESMRPYAKEIVNTIIKDCPDRIKIASETHYRRIKGLRFLDSVCYELSIIK